MLLESDILRLFFTGPYLVSSPLCSVSGVDCPSVDPRQLPLLLSNYQLGLLGRVVNSHSPPSTTSGYGEISCPRILCLVSRQNRQLNRLLWQPTPIVLHSHASDTLINILLKPREEFTLSFDDKKEKRENLLYVDHSVKFRSYTKITSWHIDLIP